MNVMSFCYRIKVMHEFQPHNLISFPLHARLDWSHSDHSPEQLIFWRRIACRHEVLHPRSEVRVKVRFLFESKVESQSLKDDHLLKWLVEVGENNTAWCIKRFPPVWNFRLISAKQNGQSMHSQLALTELASLNLAPWILLGSVQRWEKVFAKHI